MKFIHFIISAASFLLANSLLVASVISEDAPLRRNRNVTPESLKVDLMDFSRSIRRRGNEASSACNRVQQTLTAGELSDQLGASVDAFAAPGSLLNIFLRDSFVSKIKYGIQILHICAGCQDVESDSLTFQEFCGSDVYGSDATYSGILVLPLTEEGGILPGTFKGMVNMHSTTASVVPSLILTGNETTTEVSGALLLLLLDSVVASIGNVALFPDYMGYAESGNQVFKGYGIRKAYETSSVPLWLKSKQIIREQTDCKSALGNSVLVKGYSEGGYSAVALADAFDRMGVDVISVHAGGGPFRISSEATIRIFESIDSGVFPIRRRHILALLGAAYSSTYQDLSNFEQGQDLLSSEFRQTLVDLVTASTPKDEISAQMPSDLNELVGIFNPDFVSFMTSSIAAGNFDPCAGENLGPVDSLCAALRNNDLFETVQNATYEINICHSPDDEVVPFGNVPDLEGNDNLNFVLATGDHDSAGVQCIITALVAATGAAFQSITIPSEHADTCASLSPTDDDDGASAAPAPAPARVPTMSGSLARTLLFSGTFVWMAESWMA